jgi:hypothetical protein
MPNEYRVRQVNRLESVGAPAVRTFQALQRSLRRLHGSRLGLFVAKRSEALPRDCVSVAFADPIFRKKANQMLSEKRVVEGRSAWFQTTHPGAPLTCIAYFPLASTSTTPVPGFSAPDHEERSRHMLAIRSCPHCCSHRP